MQVRAGSLQELVYKGGQAGITKATVTITFDNHDKNQSPLSYESYDEFTVSRQVSPLLGPLGCIKKHSDFKPHNSIAIGIALHWRGKRGLFLQNLGVYVSDDPYPIL